MFRILECRLNRNSVKLSGSKEKLDAHSRIRVSISFYAHKKLFFNGTGKLSTCQKEMS